MCVLQGKSMDWAIKEEDPDVFGVFCFFRGFLEVTERVSRHALTGLFS